MRTFLVFLVLALLAVPHAAGAYTLSVRLVLNNTDNNVYIPGQGETGSAALGNAYYSSAPHQYLASYMSGVLSALVSDEAGSLVVNSTAENHTLQINRPASGRVLLAFTGGGWETIDDRISLVESGAFFAKMLPSFAYDIAGNLYSLKMVLAYAGIDILGDMLLGSGQHSLLISNEGLSGLKPQVRIVSL
jgi:hypothetical protein